MTSTNTAAFTPLLGTLSVIPWTTDLSDSNRGAPYLLAYSLGDGREGPEVGEQTMRTVLSEIGLRPGSEAVDLSQTRAVAITLLVQAGRAVLTMPYLKAQCPVPPEWEQDARACGKVYFMVATRPWAEGTPGKPVTEERLRAFVGDSDMLTTAAHCLVPVSTLTD
jgi:hypothetical protein